MQIMSHQLEKDKWIIDHHSVPSSIEYRYSVGQVGKWIGKNLKKIMRAKGMALSYVIREDDDPNLADQETW